jgi:hypothetical protein
MEGEVPFLWGNSKQLYQLWFMIWSSNMVLITPKHLHSNNWPVMCTMRHWICLRATFSKDFGRHLDPQSSLCHSHCHRLSSYTTSCHCTS